MRRIWIVLLVILGIAFAREYDANQLWLRSYGTGQTRYGIGEYKLKTRIVQPRWYDWDDDGKLDYLELQRYNKRLNKNW